MSVGLKHKKGISHKFSAGELYIWGVHQTGEQIKGHEYFDDWQTHMGGVLHSQAHTGGCRDGAGAQAETEAHWGAGEGAGAGWRAGAGVGGRALTVAGKGAADGAQT